MTEKQYQEARKVMQKANWLRGRITEAKGNVAKWTCIEDDHRRNLRTAQADGTKKLINRAIDQLAAWRKKFEDLKLPPEDFGGETKWITAIGNDSFKYEPKEIDVSQFDRAKNAGHNLFNSKQACQSACDQENSL